MLEQRLAVLIRPARNEELRQGTDLGGLDLDLKHVSQLERQFFISHDVYNHLGLHYRSGCIVTELEQ